MFVYHVRRVFHFRSQKFFVDRGRAFSTLHRATGRDYKNPQTANYKKLKKGQIKNIGRCDRIPLYN